MTSREQTDFRRIFTSFSLCHYLSFLVYTGKTIAAPVPDFDDSCPLPKVAFQEWMRPPVTESGPDKRSQNLWCRRNEEEDNHWYVLIIWCSHMFLSFYFQGTETEAQNPSSLLDDYSDGCLWPSKLEGNGISDPCWDRYLPNLIQLHVRHSNF